jgi:hypothetical protein
VMLPYLIFERDFNEGAARDLLSEFRRTLAFARVADTDGTVSSDETDTIEEQEPTLSTPTIKPQESQEQDFDQALSHPPAHDPAAKRATRTIQVTYSPTEWALLQARFPMSENEWEAMISVLGAMKRGLVVPSTESDS